MCKIIIHAEGEIAPGKLGIKISNDVIKDIQKLLPEIPVSVAFSVCKEHTE